MTDLDRSRGGCPPRRFDGKLALVTGASRGIGRAVALTLAEGGATILLHYARDEQAATTAAEAIEGRGGVARLVQGAFDTDDGLQRTLDQLDRELTSQERPLDFLVNNAGVSPPDASIEETGLADLQRLMAVNTLAPYALIRALLPRMADGGRIVNVSTALTRMAFPAGLGYIMSKGALEAMTLSLAQQLGGRGITVNVVAPGVIDTDMNTEWLRDDAGALPWILSTTALGRVGQPDDVADIVAFLLSDDGRWVTGQCIDASGGTAL